MRAAPGWAVWRSAGGPLDALIALAVLAGDAPTGFLVAGGGPVAQVPVPPVPLGTWLAVSVLLAAPLAVRRRVPRVSAAVVLGGLVLAAVTHGPAAVYHFGLVASAIALATLRLHRGRADAAVFGAVAAGVLGAAVPLAGPAVLGYLAYLVGGAVVAEITAARRAGQERVHRDEQRHAAQAAARDAAVEAAAGERVRIAREMHDVVTHAVSLMVVQAEGARLAVRRDPDRAEAAMGTIADAGRRTLDELRGLVTALRGADPGAEGGPGPGAVGDLVGLAATMRAAGLGVRLVPEGPRLPPGLHATGYRIVQESLTNCLRHAPPGAAVTVEVARDDDRLRISVVDDGGPGRTVPVPGPAGSGLAGMRERARAVGGTLSAGPVAAGGWRVAAELPLPEGGDR